MSFYVWYNKDETCDGAAGMCSRTASSRPRSRPPKFVVEVSSSSKPVLEDPKPHPIYTSMNITLNSRNCLITRCGKLAYYLNAGVRHQARKLCKTISSRPRPVQFETKARPVRGQGQGHRSLFLSLRCPRV